MKIGDKVYCIKDCIIEELRFFSIEEFYIIYDIIHLPTKNILYDIKSNKGNTISFDDKDHFSDYKYICHFSEYFITEKEMRKLKLDKIGKV